MSATKQKDKIARKKNVQVAVRIRPMSSSERSMGNENITSFDALTKTVLLKAINASESKRHTQGQRSFGPYDKVFGPESTQLQVYNGIVDSLMKEVLNGYNCTVFAYGQTGSGKTYTMEGSLGEYTNSLNIDLTAGIIPRALFQIFSELGSDDIDYTIRVSYIELYNEQIFDLLSQSETSQFESLRIFDDKIKGVFIAGAEEVIVRSHKEIYELLKRGAEKRRTASTLLNMTSSRSHSVFTVTVVIREPGQIDGEELLRQGKLNLVDLAGSENIERSGATNIRAREAGNINTSLLSLGRVINALTMGASHIPYRESKLTRILQDSLGGKTITTIIATISPASSNFEESVNTLDYAQRAKNIKNNPEVNLRVTRRGLLKEYNEEIDRLRRDLLIARKKYEIYLDESKAKVEELEVQLDGQLHRVKILLEEEARSRQKLQKAAQSVDEVRSLEQQLTRVKEIQTSTQSELDEFRKRELALINENTLLRQNFAECLQKAESFRDQFKVANEENEKLKAELKSLDEKKTSLEDKLQESLAELEQKSKLIAYLQSVMQPKQTQKLTRPRPSLLSSESEYLSEIESEYKQCQQLEKQRDELLNDLERKRKVLAETQNQTIENEIVPLINVRRSIREQQSISETLSQATTTESTLGDLMSGHSAMTPGKMRHDIPHRWKRQFLTVSNIRCQFCFEGFPYFTYIFRCRDCSMIVHKHCKISVVNTCGLPYECADFYLDSYSGNINGEKMTGWVKLLVLPTSSPCGATRFSCSSPVNFAITEKWQNAWAIIEKNSLDFYESDQLALERTGPPFISINLDHEQWRIYNQTTEKPLGGVGGDDMSVLIELRMPSRTLFMLAPTCQAKQRWVKALQQATNRRIFIQRRPTSTIVTNSLLLALEKPRNLCINCTIWLPNNGGDYLLIGAQEGLFASLITQQRAPFQIAGISKIFWMELLPEFDMLLTICDSNRRLGAVHLQQLNRAFHTNLQPNVYVISAAANIEYCHIAIVSKVEHNRSKRFVYVATIDSIYVLQYTTKLGVFSTLRQIKTEEPPITICSTLNGFIFGADNFRFVSSENNFGCDDLQLSVDNCPYDFPVSVIEISDNEFLLAFHNFGLFVDSKGKRTRNKNIEWEKVPLEFVYTAPHLYIVYCEFLEVVRAAPNTGLESSTLTDDRNIFKCRSAHHIGFGPNSTDVLFAVSNDNIVELHSFSRTNEEQQTSVKSILKRKLNEPKVFGEKRKY